LGLRRYLKTISPEQLKQISQSNPEYFHQMMPYAMALGVDKAFAKQFGKMPIGQCPYIAMGVDSTLQAEQWRRLMRRVLKGMNTRMPNEYLEKAIALLQSFMR